MLSLDAILPDRTLNGFTLANGNSNHVPMAAEALETLGRLDGLAKLIEVEGRGVKPLPSGAEMDSDSERAAALGRWERAGDWLATARADLRMDDWREVVPRWVALLAQGGSAGLFHGLIRTAHAVRSLARTRSNIRADELARALAYWASDYQPQTFAPAPGSVPLSVSEAIARVPMVSEAVQILTGPGRLRTAPAHALPGFGSVAWLVDLSNPASALLEIGVVFADVLAANATRAGIMFVHCVTAPAAARELVPLLSAEVAADLARHVWAGCAAVLSAQATRVSPAAGEPAPAWDMLVGRAVTSGDAHAIKCVEACQRLAAASPAADARLRVAAGSYVVPAPA